MRYANALTTAIAAAREAGAILREEFHRAGGPRGAHGHTPAEVEAENIIDNRLTAVFPHWGFRGEERHPDFRPPRDDAAHVWLVDPNDGTDAFLAGYRGSAVSIALLRAGVPVLGVVYAFVAPDDQGDLFAWAEGCGPLTRNGVPIHREAWATSLSSQQVVLVSHHADRNAAASLRCVAPGRVRALPSIAYRLALVAAGVGDAAVSLNGPVGWDYAAGHALILGAGGAFVDQNGRAPTYTRDGSGHVEYCFGGSPAVVEELRKRPWHALLGHSADDTTTSPVAFDLVRLEAGRAIADVGVLQRSQGCLLGQLAGDSLGSLVEFQSARQIQRSYPSGVRHLANGGTWNTLAGQPTDDSELALMLARSLVANGTYDVESVAQAYVGWYNSKPFDVGGTIGQALGSVRPDDVANRRAAVTAASHAFQARQSNGSLMRISPLGIAGYRLPLDSLADLARTDSRITHPNPACAEACAIFVVALALAIAKGLDPEALYRRTLDWAESNCREPAVLDALRRAEAEPPAEYHHQQGWVLIAFQNAFYQLLHAPNLEEGIVQTVMAGGDTDTNGAIVGALLGAVYGRDAIPAQWRQMVLSCRPMKDAHGVVRPRPRAFWPDDALELAERLLLVGLDGSLDASGRSRARRADC